MNGILLIFRRSQFTNNSGMNNSSARYLQNLFDRLQKPTLYFDTEKARTKVIFAV